MCGIFGKLSFGGASPLGRDILRRMADCLKPRGPDDEGFYSDGPIELGMRRLSVIDVAGGRQPMSDETGRVTIVYNGEIYNFLDLRADLEKRGGRFRTRSDTEVMLALYLKKGIAFLDDLRGMFAFALWDRESQTLILARDRLGKKPLYYAPSAGGITFASEIKAVRMAPDVSRDLHPASIDRYFSMNFIPHPDTVFAAIKKLPPAHYLVARADGIKQITRYWQLAFEPKRSIGIEDAKSELLRHLRESTRIRMISDVPLGLLLSGGLDSSAIAALAAEGGRRIKTFSVGFENGSGTGGAAEIAKQFQTDHQSLILKPQVAEILPRLAETFDEPFADSSAVPTYLIATEARKSVTVALNGDGGDEAFAGYPRYASVAAAAQALARAPEWVQESIRGRLAEPAIDLTAGSAEFLLRKLRKWLAPEQRVLFQPESFTPGERRRLYRPDFKARLRRQDWELLMRDLRDPIARTVDAAERVMAADIGLYLPGDLLVKMDMATMANSLEARSPLLDHRLLEFAAALPMRYKIRGGIQKWIFRETMRPFLPESVLSLEKKGFALPLRSWLRADLRPMIRDTLETNPRGLTRFLARDELRTVVQKILSRPSGGEKKLWALLMFELWYRGVFPE